MPSTRKMSVSIKSIFQIISFLFIAKGVVFSLSPDSEPEWNLVEEYGLFQSSDNLVAGMKNNLKFNFKIK